MMKTFLTLLTILCVINLSAQNNIELECNLLQNGSQLAMDSIYIQNVTINADTMLYAPNSVLSLVMLSNIKETQEFSRKLSLISCFPNPFLESAKFIINAPSGMLSISVFDMTGKMLETKTINVSQGTHEFNFSGGNSNYMLCAESGMEKISFKITGAGVGVDFCNLTYNGEVSLFCNKSILQNEKFVFSSGDTLKFIMYTNSCGDVLSQEIIVTPLYSQTLDFDFTSVTNLRPEPVQSLDAIEEESSIIWQWSGAEIAEGYRYNFVDDYENAVDNGISCRFEQVNLAMGNTYRLYVWAYNDCGVSDTKILFASTTTTFLTTEEIDLIMSDTTTVAMEIMNIFEQPDSMILRTPSINVMLSEEHYMELSARMLKTGRVDGVGIAAPQVGINRNVVYLQRWDKGMVSHPWEVYYNPQIIEYSDSVVRRQDGCLSVPDGNSYPDMGAFSYRATWIVVSYYDANWNYCEEKISQQYTAHIFQHEIDHLHGVMFFDRQVRENASKYKIIEGDPYLGLPMIK